MAAPKVNEKLLEDLEVMGFPKARATRALHYSGNTSLEDAINWIIDHENDIDIDEMPLVDVDIDIESTESFPITEEMRMKAQSLRVQERKRKEEEEKRLEREREKVSIGSNKLFCFFPVSELSITVSWFSINIIVTGPFVERIQAGKRLLEAKRIAEENERKRNLALKKAEKEEEKRAREKVLKKLEQDKLNRRYKQGLPLEGQAAVRSSAIEIEQEKKSKSVYNTTAKAEQLRECLRNLKRNHQGEDARVRRAFQTILVYVGNVAKNPKEDKYRKIRLNNPLFQDRVGSLNGGVEFLELCGFERTGDFLYLPDEKVDMALLNSAGLVLNSAMTNPFFGVLSSTHN
ncbi:UBX domain-containing protein 1 isoform B [Glycine soja]|uniref:UBX domain-containing protein 1 isoform B n=1 Tax=Glycine soja TaxID=3848 RepID=A0A445GGP7_GLYSO|nr:UBX domain-containing protein 1 isoform B [Glycine soja]